MNIRHFLAPCGGAGARLTRAPVFFLFGFLAVLALGGPVLAADACPGGVLPPQGTRLGGGNAPGQQPDLVISTKCVVNTPGSYKFGQVNIIGGGELMFEEPATPDTNIAFWASSIVVEANGALKVGSADTPYGTNGGFLTIYLYGEDLSKGLNPATHQGQGVLCKTPTTAKIGPCGIPLAVWNDNGKTLFPGCGAAAVGPDSKCIPGLATDVSDYFYQYGPLYGDGLCTNGSTFKVVNGKAMCGADPADGRVGYFGYKVLAVSYGGTLQMFGWKGARYAPAYDKDPLNSGASWVRLAADLKPGATSLTLDSANGLLGGKWWRQGEPFASQIVVTTTDYLPTHSERLTITKTSGQTVDFTPAIKWFHSGTRYSLSNRLGDAQKRLVDGGLDPKLVSDGAETRAAVALLTRSVRIFAAGDTEGQTFAQAGSVAANCRRGAKVPYCYDFGGHTIFRQGFKQVQIQGVQLRNLGQGGKLGHYPIHFHMARLVPTDTFVKDSSVDESQTRWYVIHSAQGVTLQRNVGWKSIGHGYYLENGTETDNNFYSNIGILARAAVDNTENPRKVPGILSNNKPDLGPIAFRTRSDNEYPTVFWIANGWNDFEGNMAAGAEACGTAYWLVPMLNSDSPDVPTADNTGKFNGHMKWDYDAAGHFGYAGFQTERNAATDARYGGATPLEVFYKNYATATMMSFQTTIDAPACAGFRAADAGATGFPTVAEIKSFAPDRTNPDKLEDIVTDPYYPHVFGDRKATLCPLLDPKKPLGPRNVDCGLAADTSSQVLNCAAGQEKNCTATVLDHFTSSFTWADGAVAAAWLRPQWYLFDNSVITDVQNGGLNFVTGGDFTHSSVIPGLWQVAKSSIFVGHTQPLDEAHKFALDIGPFNKLSGLECDPLVDPKLVPSYCLNSDLGVSFQLSDFFVNQSLFRIYDGPNYEDGDAFLDITKTDCTVTGYNSGCIYGTGKLHGIPKSVINDNTDNHDCYLPNAAIAWKQPNGFFYPPAFHSRNMYFADVGIRHYVIDPLFIPTENATIDFGQGGSYVTDEGKVGREYCDFNPVSKKVNAFAFLSYTSIDRQTELNDDDGTLTGLSNTVPAAIPPLPNLNQTISINEDEFFGAPVDTPECASNLSAADGANSLPANACKPLNPAVPPPTARTSPYDYVATVVYHPVDGDPTGGNWSRDCTNPKCYGVPLYRQFLSGTDGGSEASSTGEWKQWYKSGCGTKDAPSFNSPNCRWPFLRMAGMDKAVRETMTINNGSYYLDTAVPLDMQKNEKLNTAGLDGASLTQSFNAFLPTETYNVFFVYAKQSTKQTYQIYMGTSATKADIKPIQVKIPGSIDPGSYTGTNFLTVDDSQTAKTGIINVTVDFKDIAALAPTPDNGLCQPVQFCAKGGATGCTANSQLAASPLAIADPNFVGQAETVCGHWAIKDLDCPKAGCLGFSFTIPSTGFVADASVDKPTPHRPRPTEFPSTGTGQSEPNWLTKFSRTSLKPDSASGGQCYYPKLPGSADCPVP